MPVHESANKPECMAHFPDGEYRWLTLHDRGEIYGHAAIAERGSDLELHVTMIRWGPQVRRHVQEDVEWLKGEAQRLGLKRILGVRGNSHGEFAPNFYRFARLFGFGSESLLQMTSLSVAD